jgi:hypothetical protein
LFDHAGGRALTSSQLLDDQFAPITSEIGFLECDSKVAAEFFVSWQEPIQADRDVRLVTREVVGELPTLLKHLLPLTSVEARRYLFLPTAGRWTAFFDNGWRGTDAFSVVSYLASLIGCRGIRSVSIPHTIRKTASGEVGRFGATMLEVYSADASECSFLNIRRSISASNDGGRWRFDTGGDPLEFEQVE